MDNSSIAALLKFTATLLELHDENVFKIRALQSASLAIENNTQILSGMTLEQLSALPYLGKSIASKIIEIKTTGTTTELEELRFNTPDGVVEMLNIKGIGAKKVRTLWKELNIETLATLQEACEQNKVAALKGFGEKTQETIKQNILYKKENSHLLLYAQAELLAGQLVEIISSLPHIERVEIAGEVIRKLEVIETIMLVASTSGNAATIIDNIQQLEFLESDLNGCSPYVWRGVLKGTNTKVEIKVAKEDQFISTVYINSAAEAHLAHKLDHGKSIFQTIYKTHAKEENELFDKLQLPYIAPELREGIIEFEYIKRNPNYSLLKTEELRGVLHNHSKYSDGENTVEEMAQRCIALGYEYFGIADHSKSGNFYNGGMYENKVLAQQKEIDELNKKLFPFRIFKGIEVDILSDGALDYDDEVMATFDYVVASIHSNLKMNEEKATARTIKAIEHPSTTILGHASSRLLLKRAGFLLDYKKVIDACAANEVGIEINAHPNRLDMDWRHVIYALEKGILISINPDAHSLAGIEDMKYGVNVGRKAGLTKEMTLNAKSLSEITDYFQKRKVSKSL